MVEISLKLAEKTSLFTSLFCVSKTISILKSLLHFSFNWKTMLGKFKFKLSESLSGTSNLDVSITKPFINLSYFVGTFDAFATNFVDLRTFQITFGTKNLSKLEKRILCLIVHLFILKFIKV